MRWWRRPERVPALPAQVREGLVLARGERVLAHALRPDDGWVVVTTVALALVDSVDGPRYGPGTPSERVLWHDVAAASWDPQARVLQVRLVPAPAAAGQAVATPDVPLAFELAEPAGRLPEAVRERVMSTFVLSERVAVRGERGVTVAVRRHAVDGSLFTQTVPDDGIDPAPPPVAARVAELTRELAAQAGLAG